MGMYGRQQKTTLAGGLLFLQFCVLPISSSGFVLAAEVTSSVTATTTMSTSTSSSSASSVASSATTTATVSATTTATIATASSTTVIPRRHRTCFVDDDRATVKLLVIELLDRLLCFLIGCHFDETKSAGFTRELVLQYGCRNDLPCLCEEIPEAVISRIPGKTSYK
jgi:hypothetical protein